MRGDDPAAPGPIGLEVSPPGHLPGYGAGLSERRGGVSPAPFASLNLGRSTPDRRERVLENERRLEARLRLRGPVARIRLEHGARPLRVSAPGLHGPGDALVTAEPGLTLWLTVADCYPVAIAAGEHRALLHCGWRSVAAGLIERVAGEIVERGAVPVDRLRVWIAPGIGPCCYPVGREVASRFAPRSSIENATGTIHLDLRGEIRRRLLRLGVLAAGIAVSATCTACEPERFFSHRRDGFPSGRMAAVLWPEPR